MQKIVMFTDPNKDVDDLIAIIMMNNLKNKQILDIAGIVSTHGNAKTTLKRAVFAQGVCKLLGNDIEVCAGIPENYSDEISNLKVNRFASCDGLDTIMKNASIDKIATNSEKYLKNIFDKAEPASLDILAIAQMTDLWNYIDKNPDMFIKKVKTVSIMGGFEEQDGKLVPDNSTNNANDVNASKNVFKFLQEHNIQTKFVNRFGVMAVPVNMDFYNKFNEDGTPTGKFLYNAEQASIKGLYIGLMTGESLARQTPEWFYKTFTNIDEKDYARYKAAGIDEKIVNEILSKITKLNLYDPLTLLATIDDYKKYFKSEKKANFELLMPDDKHAIYNLFNQWAHISVESVKIKLTLKKAKELLLLNPNGSMPTSKNNHSLEVGRVARKIAEKCGLDGEEAEILGIIHDIGGLWNLGVQHPYIGYKYIKSLGYDDKYADICLTHSFINGNPNCTADGLLVENEKVKPNNILPWENEEDSKFVLNFLKTHKYSKIENIINLCDLMITDKIIGLDKRLIDLIEKKGAHVTTQNHIKVARALQASIEKEMGCSILDLFPEIIDNQKSPETYRTSMSGDVNQK